MIFLYAHTAIDVSFRVDPMQELWNSICLTVSHHYNVYLTLLLDAWRQITPTQYTILLLSIGLIGVMLMKSGLKRI